MSAAPAGPGRLYGVGVGPGDPDLVTLKAARLIAAADVVAYPVAPRATSGGVARTIAGPHLRSGVVEVALTYPVTIEPSEHPGGYEAAITDFYDESAAELAGHLDAGRDVVVLCEGDPFFYGSYMYLHERLAHRYVTEVVPGVTSFSAAAAAAGTPLAKRDDVLTILPGTLPADVLAARLRTTDAAVVMKLGRTFAGVRDAAEAAGVAERAVYVERASSPREHSAALRDVDPGEVPYMSLVLVPTAHGRATDAGAAGSVTVVGLGPAGPQWLTPEAQSELAGADVLIGYKTYIDRVAPRHGQQRFATDNRVEADRARHALDLAAAGSRVAVVSSGDPGIFAMASAVLEALENADGAAGAVEVRVVPGLSAMQVAASRVGAPLGHDFAVVSLSDVLKPWAVIERRLEAAAGADMALALYNPASRTRREQLERAMTTLRRHRGPGTPVVVARAVGSDAESVTVTTLGALDLDAVDMRTLLIVGSSTTRIISANGAGGGDRVYTPRRHPG
ncbi:MAG: Precorrin-2 C(20)-methyltransferase / Precorrin-3B C(17)-methyltransferase [uncultured Solirubrobacteraceae bacterium]|uniref:Precorrin-2 C(20)-methyltransferase / Precorrin-3B C(17)-methyltransferase n=1 Tax=uncultured Solirubrobacteraceae bacterium TaxID=1162706 RepID=A0A6J4RF31_9ACTN|nr:MAG: Precorrin-2 C(20)-methyltransferase / Precorrin-3B C(17)-methyltransferase [uncultured Solirubrobacteraceae bacterium]